jgi:RNA polymerase sigma-70 factor (ECF subfamily)
MAPQGLVATFSPAASPATEAAPAVSRSTVVDLFDLHAPALFRFAAAMLRDPDAAQDVVQDAFLKLVQHLAAGGPLPNPRGWLFTVVAHGCRDRQRRAWRLLPWTPELDRRASGDTANRIEDREIVRAALLRLRDRDRLLVALKAQGLTYEEMAAAASIRATSIGRLLARALDRLGRELDRLQEVQP